MKKRLREFERFVTRQTSSVLVEVRHVQGSAPREKDAWMLVGAKRTFGTIGGGQLEFDAIDKARAMLSAGTDGTHKMNVTLGPDTGQCCGGVVDLYLGRTDQKQVQKLRKLIVREISSLPHVVIFGAGHVGLALAETMALLPVSTVLVDTREGQLSGIDLDVETRCTAIPEAEVRSAPAGSAFVVLTHDHALDFLITKEALYKGNAAYVGMIGSRTKRATFRNWFMRENGNEQLLDTLICPIGNTRSADKRPQVIAAFAAAEVMEALLLTAEGSPQKSESAVDVEV